jgi:hypothetical protein
MQVRAVFHGALCAALARIRAVSCCPSLKIARAAKRCGRRFWRHFVAENLLDRDPPLIAGSLSSGFYQGQANARFYDRLGRMLRLGARFKFLGGTMYPFLPG